MLKIFKFVGLISAFFIVLYGVSFLFSNTGLSPSNESKTITRKSDVSENQASSYIIPNQDIPEVKAASFEVIDLSTNQVLLSKRPDSALLVASLTKLMTAWIVINYGQLTDQYQITDQDIKSFSPTLGLIKGDKVQVSDLLNAMLIGSANDAALALSHYVEKKQQKTFPELMNTEAKDLQLNDTRFSNPNGFDSDTNYSSSNDLKKLFDKLSQRHVFDSTSRATSYYFSGALQKTYQVTATNQLLSNYKDLYAIKTGYTNEAQGSMINLLKVDRNEYLIIVLGSPDREADTLKLREIIINSNLGNR